MKYQSTFHCGCTVSLFARYSNPWSRWRINIRVGNYHGVDNRMHGWGWAWRSLCKYLLETLLQVAASSIDTFSAFCLEQEDRGNKLQASQIILIILYKSIRKSLGKLRESKTSKTAQNYKKIKNNEKHLTKSPLIEEFTRVYEYPTCLNHALGQWWLLSTMWCACTVGHWWSAPQL